MSDERDLAFAIERIVGPVPQGDAFDEDWLLRSPEGRLTLFGSISERLAEYEHEPEVGRIVRLLTLLFEAELEDLTAQLEHATRPWWKRRPW